MNVNQDISVGTDRIGHYEFEITKDDVKYAVILQQDTYEWNIQLTVQIGI